MLGWENDVRTQAVTGNDALPCPFRDAIQKDFQITQDASCVVRVQVISLASCGLARASAGLHGMAGAFSEGKRVRQIPALLGRNAS